MEVKKGYMENFKLGNCNQCALQLPPILQSSIKSIVKKEGFISHNVESKKISTEGGNYLAVLYEIDVTGNTSDGDKEINLFVKNIIPVNESFGEFISTTRLYLTESYVYKDLSKIFKQLQDKAGIPEEDRYKMVKGYDESSSEAIILENASRKGFKTCDRMRIVSYEFVSLSVQQLAKFHGLGFAIKTKLPEFYEKELLQMAYPLTFNEEWDTFYKNMAKVCMKKMRDDYKKKVECFVENVTEKFRRYINDTTTTRTMCHGDFRAANILMKEEEVQVTEVIPVDFQIVNCGCPVNDLFYFIYGCTDREFRRQYMDEIINLYYDTLTNFLKYFEIDVADVYPRKELEAAMKEREDFGLVIALGFYPFFFAPENNFPDLAQDNVTAELDLDAEIVGRIEEIIEDLDVKGLL